MENYYIVNKETGKLELHFEKSIYQALSEEQKSDVKHNFLWGRQSGCWISRCKEPNLYFAKRCAEKVGLQDGGTAGERLSYAEQMERKAEKAEHRAERYEHRAEQAEKRGEQLQDPINRMHSDIAFFTQPNINTSAGRAFARQRERMLESYEQGFKEFRKSEYWQERSKVARATADGVQMKSKGFIQRRIDEREADLRALRRNVEEYNAILAAIDKGETPRNHFGWEVKADKRESYEKQLEYWYERIEIKLDELGYYMDALDALGGVGFSRDNLKKGDLLILTRWHDKTPVRYLKGGPKNFTYEFTEGHMTYADGSQMQGKAAYAEIERRAD